MIIVGSANIDAAGRFGPSIGATIEHIETVIAQARARMADAGGAVVVVSPPLGSEAEGGVTATAVMQRALTGLVRGLALELGDSAIRANVVLPGVLRESAACLPGVIPLIRDDTGDRRGSAEDVANAVTYLVSEDSSYITGIELVVDGGLSQCRSSGTFALWDAGVIDAFTPPSPLGA
ncbi:SDR family oxidoreductase [Nonomuraea sp. NPDC050153]|uniref:SDR family oxidoreductase n=1 Tax=Nonomuraea sp. NPDC050153 TaxID=3364359 RepID=UPI0037ABAB4A